MREQNGTIYAARTNKSATKVGAANAIRLRAARRSTG